MESVAYPPGTEYTYDFVIRLQHGNDVNISPLSESSIYSPHGPSEVHCLRETDHPLTNSILEENLQCLLLLQDTDNYDYTASNDLRPLSMEVGDC